MLYTITWGQFCATVLPILIIYYGVVLVKYYRRELVAFFSGRKEAPRGQGVAANVAGPVVEQAPAQPELFEGAPGKWAGVEQEGSAEMFKVMEKVVALLKSVVAKGVSDGIERGELMMQIGEVLSKYGHLRGTPYQGAVNGFLVRTCSSNFSLVLEEGDLAALWG